MPPERTVVTNVDEILEAAKDPGARLIVIHGELKDSPSIRLSPEQSLQGEGMHDSISFAENIDGLQLSKNNRVSSIRLCTSANKRAIFNDTNVESLGRIELQGVTTVGQVQILAQSNVRAGNVIVDGLDIVAADARLNMDRPNIRSGDVILHGVEVVAVHAPANEDRPNGYGVNVTQGAFTLWNMQPDENTMITADLIGISVGRSGAPVLGSGVFVSGAGFKGGRLVASRLETGPVFSNGKINPGTPDQITGGVFTLYNAHVDQVCNHGPIVTYGANDMALDNWGYVKHWLAEGKVTSFGPSGIGFVNFGIVNQLSVNAPIETFGQGARGFNVYTGTVGIAEFDRITTHGDGAVGIQISQPVGKLVVRNGIETFGGTGESLVKGVIVKLSAIGLSIKPGGSAREIEIDGGIRTNGKGVSPIEMEGRVESFTISGGCVASSWDRKGF